MSEYGLSGFRDKDGKRQTVEHTYTWDGQEVTIKLDPPTISQQEEYEQLGEEADSERLREIVDRHVVEPSIPEDEEWTTREVMCYLEGIINFSVGGGGEMGEAIRDEIEARGGTPGN